MSTVTPDLRQSGLTGVHCHYASRRHHRPDCEGLAVVAYGPTALCSACSARRSAVGRTHVARKLPGAELARLGNAARRLAEAAAAMGEAAAGARRAGASWAQIGNAAGVTRQAAQQRWRRASTIVNPP